MLEGDHSPSLFHRGSVLSGVFNQTCLGPLGSKQAPMHQQLHIGYVGEFTPVRLDVGVLKLQTSVVDSLQ